MPAVSCGERSEDPGSTEQAGSEGRSIPAWDGVKPDAAASRRHEVELLRVVRLDPCSYCGCRPRRKLRTLDHIVPVAVGGLSEAANLTAACTLCDGAKAHHDLLTFLLVRDELAVLEQRWRAGARRRAKRSRAAARKAS